MKTIVILVSGRGSNMQAIIQAQQAGLINVKIAAVISNTEKAKALETARNRGIPTRVVPSAGVSDRKAYDRMLLEAIEKYQPDLLVLAGFMRILTAEFVQYFAGRIINIHPSLLPAFIGLDTHRRALEAGVRAHGATVHFVTEDLDAGPIIAQAVVPVLPDDTEKTLAARVLDQEHILYPRVIGWFADGDLKLEEGRVVLNENISRSGAYLLMGEFG